MSYTVLRNGQPEDVPVRSLPYPHGSVLARHWGGLLLAITGCALGAVVSFRRPGDRSAGLLFLTWAGVTAGVFSWIFGVQVSDLVSGVGYVLWSALRGAYLLGWAAALHLALVFPRPFPFVTKHGWVSRLVYVVPFTAFAAFVIATRFTAGSVLAWLGWWHLASRVLHTLLIASIAVALVAGFRNAGQSAITRLQIRWIVFAFALPAPFAIGLGTLPEIVLGHPLVDYDLILLTFLPIPVALAFAILRYRLFDIDVVVRRTLVYGGLTVCVIALYVLVVGGFGALFQTSGNLVISLLATALIAVIFQPLRERLQRTVNHLLYGQRDEPYAVLSRLGQRLDDTLAPDAVLPSIVQTVREALKLPYVAIALCQADELVPTAASGQATGEVLRLPLVYQHESVGELQLAARGPDEGWSLADRRLLEDLARQAGVAAHAVLLAAELQRSRERLVSAREEERRRLRRDLHDELAPTLAALALSAATARDRSQEDPTTTGLLDELYRGLRGAVGDIRRLVYELRPPALDELGLVAAIRERAAQYSRSGLAEADGLNVSVQAPADLPPLPAAVEVAAYRIVQEALMNVARHAQAHTCTIHLALGDGLELEVADDGVGLPETYRAGVGLGSMREGRWSWAGGAPSSD